MIYHCSRLYRKYIIIIFVEAVVMFVWAMGRGSWSWDNILTRNQRVFSMLLHLSELWLGRKCGQNHQLKCPNMGECRYAADWASQGAKELCPWVRFTSTKPFLLLFHFLSLRISLNIPPCISPRRSWMRLSTQGRKQECGFCKLETDNGRVVSFSYQIFHIRAFEGQNYCDDPSQVWWV